MQAQLEPISPELVLVAPELRPLALARLSEAEDHALNGTAPATEPDLQAPASPPVVVQLVLYAAWQAVTGALFGLAAFVVFVALVLLKPFL